MELKNTHAQTLDQRNTLFDGEVGGQTQSTLRTDKKKKEEHKLLGTS